MRHPEQTFTIDAAGHRRYRSSMRAFLFALVFVAGCGGAGEAFDAGPDLPEPPPQKAWAGVASVDCGPHLSCELGGGELVHLATPDCAGLVAAYAGWPCPNGATAILSCDVDSVTLDCGVGCINTCAVTYR